MNDILVVSLNKTYKDNCSKEYLQKITTGDWILHKSRIENIKYLVGMKNKEVKSIYKVLKEPIYISDKNRYRFCDVEEEFELSEKIKSAYNNTVKVYCSRRYFNSEDL